MLSSFLICVLAASSPVWAEPALSTTDLADLPSSKAEQTLRVYGARGETELIQCVFQSRKKGYKDLSFTMKQRKDRVSTPLVYRFPDPDMAIAASLPDDVLLPASGTAVVPESTTRFVLQFSIPQNMEAGIYTAEFEIRAGEKVIASIPLRLEVFDFTLPTHPPSPYLVHASVSTPGELGPVLELCQQMGLQPLWHIPMGATALADALSTLSGDSPTYLALDGDMQQNSHTLEEMLPHLNKVTAVTTMPQDRSQWTEAMIVLAKWGAQDEAVQRLLRGGLYPAWQSHVEAWAAPLAAWDPVLIHHAKTGLVVVHGQAMNGSIQATTPDEPGLTWMQSITQPRDGIDGSRATAWYTRCEEGETQVKLTFPEAIDLSAITLYWAPGAMAQKMDLRSSVDDIIYSTATVDWEHEYQRNGSGRSEGELAYTHLGRYFTLTLKADTTHHPLGIQEIIINDSSVPPTQKLPVIPWLDIIPDSFPASGLGTHPASLRLSPWIVAQLDLHGAIGLQGNWDKGTQEGLWVWIDGQLYPTLRLFHLRDGWEDLHYCATPQADGDGYLVPALLPYWSAMDTLSGNMLDSMLNDILASRVVRGRVQTNETEK